MSETRTERIDRQDTKGANSLFALVTHASFDPDHGWVDMEATAKDAERLQALAEEELGTEVTVRYSDLNVGRGGDAAAAIFELVIMAWGALVASGKLMKMTRESADEWLRLARALGIPTKIKALRGRLTRGFSELDAVTFEIVALSLVATIEERTHADAHLVWWEDLALDPMDWNGSPEGLPSTPERIYSFVIESAGYRYYIVTKADGTMLTDTAVWLPSYWMEYGLWRPDPFGGPHANQG